jgi:hypothetical protein
MDMSCGFCDDGHQSIEDYWHCAALHGSFRKRAPVDVTFVEDGEPATDEEAPVHSGVRMLPLLWGMPAPGAYEAEKRGEVIVAGSCLIGPDSERWACPVCGHREGVSRQWMESLERMERRTDRSHAPDSPWWTKARMWFQHRVTGDI